MRFFSSGKTSRVLSFFHRVDDQIESYVDVSTLVSLRTKIRFKEGGRLRSYDITVDPQQENPIHDETLETRLANKMKELLGRFDAPECQYTRMGLN